MLLREGWDVRNVTVVLGLRPFTAQAEILPEQVIGRGLRLMTQISPDQTQTLEVLGTRNLLKILREQLEAEGVGVASTKEKPLPGRSFVRGWGALHGPTPLSGATTAPPPAHNPRRFTHHLGRP